MNKKIIANISIISLLSACSSWTKPYDTELLKNNSISATVDAYDEYKKVTESKEKIKYNRKGNVDMVNTFCLVPPLLPICFLTLFSDSKTYDYTTLAEKDSLDCWYLNDNSDKCIVYRRNHKKENSKVNFFDYKRFLPKDSNIKTDDDFLRLVNKYKEYKNDEYNKDTNLKYCYNIYEDNSLTSTEKDEKYTQCEADNKNTNNNIEELLKSYIFGGLEEDKKQEQLKKELARQQKTEYINDCEQAEKKASEENKKLKDYMEKINYYSLEDLNKYKVVDFAKDGVMIKREVNVRLAYALTGTFPTEKLYFVYTEDTNYANGDYFRGGEYYYKISNNVYKYTTVTGGTNSISVFVPTKYKIKDVEKNIEKQTDYRFHLKNKNILDCRYGYKDDIYYKDENGEEHRINRREYE